MSCISSTLLRPSTASLMNYYLMRLAFLRLLASPLRLRYVLLIVVVVSGREREQEKESSESIRERIREETGCEDEVSA